MISRSMANKPGGYRGTQGNIKDDVASIRLRDSPARTQLNAIVAYERAQSGDRKISHKAVVEQLIAARWRDLDAAPSAAADAATDGAA